MEDLLVTKKDKSLKGLSIKQQITFKVVLILKYKEYCIMKSIRW